MTLSVVKHGDGWWGGGGLGRVFENSPDIARRTRVAVHSAPRRPGSEEDILRVRLLVRLKGRNPVKNCEVVQHALSVSPQRTELYGQPLGHSLLPVSG